MLYHQLSGVTREIIIASTPAGLYGVSMLNSEKQPDRPSRKPCKELPNFGTEEQELQFWDTHDPSQYFTEPADIEVRLRRLRP